MSKRTTHSPLPFQWESGDRPSSMFPFLIRTARLQDLRELSDLLADSFYARSGYANWLLPLFRLGIYEDLRHRFHAPAPHYACLAAVDYSTLGSAAAALNVPTAVVGTVEVGVKSPKFWDTQTQPYLYISNLAVRPAYRRRGVALRLLNSCEQIARDWGFSDLYLHVLETNSNARQLYQKAGYRMEGVDVGLPQILFGKPRQIFLRKRLKGEEGNGKGEE